MTWTLTPRRALAFAAIDDANRDGKYAQAVQERALEALVYPSRAQGKRTRATARVLLEVASWRAVVLWDLLENPGTMGLEDDESAESAERIRQVALDLLDACEGRA